jgi:hypothetical protein
MNPRRSHGIAAPAALFFVVPAGGSPVSTGIKLGAKVVGSESDKVDLARGLHYPAKVKGKTPEEATASLGLGTPALVVGSEITIQLSQLYDARLVEGLSGAAYCILRFDSGACTKVDMVKVKASKGQK